MTGLHAALAGLADEWASMHLTGFCSNGCDYIGHGNRDRFVAEIRALLDERPADLPVATDSTTASGFTRLSVLVNDDCAAHVAAMREQGMSATEVVRRALSLHACMHAGGRIIPPASEPSNSTTAEIEDGFGGVWPTCGPDCDLQVVRPGKVQCNHTSSTCPDAPAPEPSGRERGLYGKYRVERISDPTGKHADCRYFVLDPQHDPIAREALAVYARFARRNGYFELADDLGQWVHGLNEADRAEALPATGQVGRAEHGGPEDSEHGEDDPGQHDARVEPSDRAGLSEAIHEAVVKYAAPMTSAGRESLQETVGEIQRLFADRLAVAERARTRQRDSLSAHADELASEQNQALARAEAAEQKVATLQAQVAAVEALLPAECWISRTSDIRCIDYVGGAFPNGSPFAEDACCLPCRIRAALGDSAQIVQRIKDEAAADAWEKGARAGHHSPLTWFALRSLNPHRERARRVRDGGE